MFQHFCRIEVERADLDLARRAVEEPGLVPIDKDLILGRTSTWAGHDVQVRLCGRENDTALLAVAVYNPDGSLMTYRNSTTYQTGFTFRENGLEFLVNFVPKN